jgi:hypothetical protein
MGVMLQWTCGGCFATATSGPVRQRFESVNGRGYGLGSFRVDSVRDHTPEGWTAFDSIGATYCPSCTEELWPTAEQEQTDAD